jgi:hypothetical protein
MYMLRSSDLDAREMYAHTRGNGYRGFPSRAPRLQRGAARKH